MSHPLHSAATPNVWAKPPSTDWCSLLQSYSLSESICVCWRQTCWNDSVSLRRIRLLIIWQKLISVITMKRHKVSLYVPAVTPYVAEMSKFSRFFFFFLALCPHLVQHCGSLIYVERNSGTESYQPWDSQLKYVNRISSLIYGSFMTFIDNNKTYMH